VDFTFHIIAQLFFIAEEGRRPTPQVISSRIEVVNLSLSALSRCQSHGDFQGDPVDPETPQELYFAHEQEDRFLNVDFFKISMSGIFASINKGQKNEMLLNAVRIVPRN